MTDRLNTEVAVPLGWMPVSFGAVVTLKTGPFGSALHKSDYVIDGAPLINPTHIRDGRLVPDMSITVSEPTKARLTEYVLQSGDVVMGRRGEMGRCAVVSGDAVGWICGTGSVVVRPKMAITSNFLQKFLSSPVTVAALNGDAVGSTMVNLNQSVLLNLTVNLPPLPEQTRIADKLDTVLTRVDACRDRLARVAPLLKRFRQSVLAAATSGQLTEDWRDLSCESLWIDCCVGDFTLSSYYGPRFGATEYTLEDSGIPTIRTTDMTAKGLIEITQATPRVLVKPEKINDYVVRRGDLLVTRTGSIGVMAIFDGEYLAIPSAYLIRFRFRDIIIPKYAYMLLSAPAGQDAMGLSTTTTTQPNINAEAIKRIKVNLPPKEEQAEIIRRVETLFAFADRLEARLKAAQTAADRLTPALLAKAFRGELVPQDPNDEPAAELLKRLATSRDAAPKAKRGRRSATADTTP